MKVARYLVLLATAVAGCTNTVWVKEKHQDGDEVQYKDVPGIPFYIKKEVWDQSTTYSQTWLKASLTVEKKKYIASPPSYVVLDSQMFTKQVVNDKLSELNKIKEKIMKPGVLQNNEVVELVTEFSKIASFEDIKDIEDIDKKMIGNSITSKWVVNEKEKYYLNAPLPWFGSSNLTQEINPNGTLSKVVSNPDTKLAEGVSSLIPFKEYLTSKHVDKKDDDDVETVAETAAEKSSEETIYVVSLTIEETGYLYTLSKTHEEVGPDIKPISFKVEPKSEVESEPKSEVEPESYFYTRTVLSSKKKKEEKGKDKGKKVGLSGSISFPEGWGKG